MPPKRFCKSQINRWGQWEFSFTVEKNKLRSGFVELGGKRLRGSHPTSPRLSARPLQVPPAAYLVISIPSWKEVPVAR